MKAFIQYTLCLSLCFILCAMGGMSAYAQQSTLKTGYANVEYILSLMPEADRIQADLKTYENQIKNRLESKIEEFKTKGEDLERNYQGMSDLERADKQEELQTMQESILKFQREAELSMQDKQQKLLEPVLKKIQDAIDNIAKEKGYNYLFKAESLLYANEKDDISHLVLKKLGITPPPPTSK